MELAVFIYGLLVGLVLGMWITRAIFIKEKRNGC